MRVTEVTARAGDAASARKRQTRGMSHRGSRGMSPPRFICRAGLTALMLAASFGISACSNALSAQLAPPRSPVLTVQSGVIGRPVPAGFVGLSMEYRGLEAYVGQNPKALSPPFVQLLRNLAPNQPFGLRIGGDSTDWTWYPLPHVGRPPGVRYDLGPNWARVAHALVQTLDARLVLGVNLEASSRTVAAGEARALLAGVGRRYVQALELGNEPELYPSFNWYRTPGGVGVKGRPRGYGFPHYLGDFSSFARALPPVALAGPSAGGPQYESQLGSFVHAEPRVGLITLHAYPLKHCTRSTVVTPGQLLSDGSEAGLANGQFGYVRIADRRHLPLRIDELNGVSCGGKKGVSNAFVSSLWMLDTLYQMARVGVAGVNIHTVPNTINEVIGSSQVHGRWQAKVHPEYYGMMMFAQAAPPGARLLRTSSAADPGVQDFATRARDGHVRVVLINRDAGSRTVAVRIPSGHGPAVLERLEAPGLQAEGGVTLGGQSFGAQTTTGRLAGASRLSTIKPSSGSYPVTLPGSSAAMLTL